MKKLVLKELNIRSFTTTESKKIDGGLSAACNTGFGLCESDTCTGAVCSGEFNCTRQCTFFC